MRNLARQCGLWCYAHRHEFTRYVITGFSSFAIDYGLFLLMTKVADIWYPASSALSQAASIAFNFLINKYWSFKSGGKTHQEAVRYGFILAFNYFVQLAVLVFLVEALQIPKEIAKIISSGVVVLWTFPVYKLWVFRP